ncbi:MAG: 23S rRNA (pseudouridine(1915)-N(3))-methyltransferase RlmH [Woeseia sp.]
MHIRLIAVGDRQPAWVLQAFDQYVRRLPRQWQFRLDVVVTARRGNDNDALKAKQIESRKVLEMLQPAEQVVLLDETGRQWTSAELAAQLLFWQDAGRDLVFVIGGPDGMDDECHKRADLHWSLSNLTLPHGLARVLFAEQLYRAWTMTTGHPYHRA